MKSQKTAVKINREFQSELFKAGKISTTSYTTIPGVDISIKGDLSSNVVEDIKFAIDQVLKNNKL